MSSVRLSLERLIFFSINHHQVYHCNESKFNFVTIFFIMNVDYKYDFVIFFVFFNYEFIML